MQDMDALEIIKSRYRTGDGRFHPGWSPLQAENCIDVFLLLLQEECTPVPSLIS